MLKPLTAAEIAVLRNTEAAAALDPLGLDAIAFGDCAVEVLPRLLDEVERSRALLKRIEWKAAFTGEDGHCPACGYGGGHAPGCELAALLGVVG